MPSRVSYYERETPLDVIATCGTVSPNRATCSVSPKLTKWNQWFAGVGRATCSVWAYYSAHATVEIPGGTNFHNRANCTVAASEINGLDSLTVQFARFIVARRDRVGRRADADRDARFPVGLPASTQNVTRKKPMVSGSGPTDISSATVSPTLTCTGATGHTGISPPVDQ
jgi:hypothetical protein